MKQAEGNGGTDAWAFGRYEAVRHRLPDANFPATSVAARDLGELLGAFDAFVFDSFGVLNVGDVPIPGARDRVESLRAAGKKMFVLTNAATVPLAALEQKYSALGFNFTSDEIVSSREVLAKGLVNYAAVSQWGVAAPESSNIDELPISGHLLTDTSEAFDQSEGFIVLSSAGWN
ncbi:MAG: TIGR01459 family HAD-type hydrolase, partial [Methyloligellaceae bacterium]